MYGLTSTKNNATSAGDPAIVAHFHPPRVAGSAGEDH
jgi:hypothetical protein